MSKHVFLNLEQRIEVLRQYENGKSARKSSELFNCGRTQINKAIKEKDLILKEYEDFKFRGVKRIRHKNGPMIQHKAKELADRPGIENFSVTNLWLDRFRIRNNITCRSLCGETADVDPSSCEGWQERLPLVLAGYDDKVILNMDEKTLFFRALPNKIIQKHDSKIRRSQR
ncbi:hypothetical protein AVEN_111156-1 [Araneus ventricosus]|uniref:HTH CENPB-type domain-containing protein n=1 Tax=Araneus ventricosus TaxID=182803 RepID=A0A4Y2ERF0_ARAVE|nr:hypothetical protein AVEN_111156-1 [Araneus ventricosus]